MPYRFSRLPSRLLEDGFLPHSFDGIVIDTVFNTSISNDSTRSIGQSQQDVLDLRIDPSDDNTNTPTASEILQYIEERDLYRLLRTYSELGSWSKFVATAVIEARYLFHKFQTIEVNKKGHLKAIYLETTNLKNFFPPPPR